MEASHSSLVILFVFKILFIYFLERGEGREKERERIINVWLPLSHPLLGNQARNPGLCPDWESNQQHFVSQPALNPLSHPSQSSLLILDHMYK